MSYDRDKLGLKLFTMLKSIGVTIPTGVEASVIFDCVYVALAESGCKIVPLHPRSPLPPNSAEFKQVEAIVGVASIIQNVAPANEPNASLARRDPGDSTRPFKPGQHHRHWSPAPPTKPRKAFERMSQDRPRTEAELFAALQAALGQRGYRLAGPLEPGGIIVDIQNPTTGQKISYRCFDLNEPSKAPTAGTVCTDCLSTDSIAYCTECGKPVCPDHRAGTGRLQDGYQCKDRECWAVVGHRVFAEKRANILPGGADLMAFMPESPSPDDPQFNAKVLEAFVKLLADNGLRPATVVDPESERVIIEFPNPGTGNAIKIACVPLKPPEGGQPS